MASSFRGGEMVGGEMPWWRGDRNSHETREGSGNSQGAIRTLRQVLK